MIKSFLTHRRNDRIFSIRFAVCLVLAFMAISLEGRCATAATLVYEPFNYSAGSLGGNSGGTGFAVASSWTAPTKPITAQSGSLSYGALDTSGNKIYLAPDNIDNALSTRPLSATYGGVSATGEVWLSFLANVETLGNRFLYLTLFDGGTNRLEIGRLANSFSPTGNWGLTRNVAGSTNASSISAVAGNTVMLVARIGWNESGVNEDIRLWVNPTLGDSAPTLASANAVLTNQNIVQFNALRVGAGGGSVPADNNTIGWVDEIRIGNTWNDVTTVVPEPGAGSLLMIVLGIFGLLRVRPRANT